MISRSPHGLSRRAFVGGALLAGTVTGMAFAALSRSADLALAIGLQLFSVDAEMHRDLVGTFRAVKAIGYREVELVGYYGRSIAELKSALHNAGLECHSIHLRPQQIANGLPSLAQDPDLHFARCRELGVQFVVCPGPWFPERIAGMLPASNLTIADVVAAVGQMRADDWQRSAELINTTASSARKHGLQLAYHNGNFEFASVDGETGFARLLRLLDPELVKLELDCGWVMAAGYDPIAIMKEQRGRIPMLHVKDMKQTPPNTAMQLNSTELGTGIVAWRELLQAAQTAGVQRIFVEQEAPFVRPALESARINYQFLKSFKL